MILSRIVETRQGASPQMTLCPILETCLGTSLLYFLHDYCIILPRMEAIPPLAVSELFAHEAARTAEGPAEWLANRHLQPGE